jgi:hypothetical protein
MGFRYRLRIAVVVSATAFAVFVDYGYSLSTSADHESALRSHIAELLAVIDLYPMEGHGWATPAVEMLIQIGEPALLPTLDAFVASEDRGTRSRCTVVIGSITRQIVVEQLGIVLDPAEMETNFDAYQDKEIAIANAHYDLWRAIGDLDHSAPLGARAASVARWKQWLKTVARVPDIRPSNR